MMVFAAAPFTCAPLPAENRPRREPRVFHRIHAFARMDDPKFHLQLTYLFLWGARFYTLYETFALKATWAVRGKRLGLAAERSRSGLCHLLLSRSFRHTFTPHGAIRCAARTPEVGHATNWSLHQEELAGMLLPGFIGVDVYEEKQGTLGTELDGSSFVNFSVSDYQNAGIQGSPDYWGHNPFKLSHDSCGILLTFLAFLAFSSRQTPLGDLLVPGRNARPHLCDGRAFPAVPPVVRDPPPESRASALQAWLCSGCRS